MERITRRMALILLFFTAFAAIGRSVCVLSEDNCSLVSGLSLLLVVGLPTAFVFFKTLQDDRRYPFFLLISGLILGGWLIGEILLKPHLAPLQYIYAVISFLLLYSGYATKAHLRKLDRPAKR